MYSLFPFLLKFFAIPKPMKNGKLPWLRAWLCGVPHFIVGGLQNPYLLRWHITPRNPVFNIYLHKFLRDDDDRALHDHPWFFISWIIKGSYGETLETKTVQRRRWSFAFRPATTRHRVFLDRDSEGNAKPCWTIVITGRTVREWGFACKNKDGSERWVHWEVFCSSSINSAEIGRGCD